MSTPYDTTLCVEELRDALALALALHDITLPSLGMDILYAGLVALGNCNTATSTTPTTSASAQRSW
jgi:hypothetical protein